MKESIGVVILAAGKGTRMKIETPKALVPALGLPLLDHVVNGALLFAHENGLQAEVGVVIGHRRDLLEQWWKAHSMKSSLKLALQEEQRGTADALRACFKELPHFWDHTYTLVACADTPLLRAQELIALFNEFKTRPDLEGVVATFEASDPSGYGRIIRGTKGLHIVEEKDTTQNEKLITEVNSGLYIFKTKHIKAVLDSIKNENKSGEFYLTDLFQDQFEVKALKFSDETSFLGINTLAQLAHANELLLERKLNSLQENGVMFLSPKTVFLEQDVSIEAGSVVFPGVTILGKTVIGREVTIESGCFIKSSQIGDKVEILANSYLEEAKVHSEVVVGPMARLRTGTEIGSHSKIGNFVEIKKSKLAQGVKVSHLSYVGDAEIGENTNIGCGFITCNYDGIQKHKTKIGKNTFIGSDCQMIAPLEIGDDAFIAAGSTINKNIPDGSFAIARSQQVIKEGAAKRFLKTKKS